METPINKLFDLFLAADKVKALEFIDECALEKSYDELMKDLVEPALQKFGAQWAKEEDVNLAQGYIAAKISEEVLKRISAEREKSGIIKVNQGIAVIGNIEDDYHALGRKMIGNFLQSSGWEVHDLGNDVLAEDFVDKAVEVNASVIGVSAMMYTNAQNMIKVRHDLDNRGLSKQIKFAVGGAIFNLRPELVEEVCADGTAPNAMEAVNLFNELSKQGIQNEQH